MDNSKRRRKRWEETNTFIPKTTIDSSINIEEDPVRRWFASPTQEWKKINFQNTEQDNQLENGEFNGQSQVMGNKNLLEVPKVIISSKIENDTSPIAQRKTNKEGSIIISSKAVDLLFS